MNNRQWTDNELQLLINLREQRPALTWRAIARALPSRTEQGCRHKYQEVKDNAFLRIKQSPYPVYDKPLTMEGDALILPDPEFPFHHADFINRCIELAMSWGITQCIVAGDALHFNSLSGWEANWMVESKGEGLTEEQAIMLQALADRIPFELGQDLLDILEDIGPAQSSGSPNISEELAIARKGLNALGSAFELIDFIMGNHEGRFLRALNSPLFPEDFLQFLGLNPKWRVAPYYYSMLISNGEPYQIEHPKSAAKYAAQYLADKYQCHILMAHSHRISMVPSKSGRWMGWQIGCCVDEDRLPYAAQRHNTRDAHALGAAIVRDGCAYILTDIPGMTDWNRLREM